MDTTEKKPRWDKRVLWFIALYCAGAGVTILLAYGLKALLPPH